MYKNIFPQSRKYTATNNFFLWPNIDVNISSVASLRDDKYRERNQTIPPLPPRTQFGSEGKMNVYPTIILIMSDELAEKPKVIFHSSV